MVDVVVSIDDVVAQLQLAASDVAVEQQLSAPATGPQLEAIPAFTDELVRSGDAPLPGAIAAGLGPDQQAAIVTAARDKVAEISKDFSEWRKTVFSASTDGLKTIAQKVTDDAARLGVSAEHLIGRLQRRVMAALVQNTVLPPFQVAGQGNQQVMFSATDVTVTSTIRSSPSLATLDLAGVVQLLSGILGLELDIAVCYNKAGS
jgi:hypothetical protein